MPSDTGTLAQPRWLAPLAASIGCSCAPAPAPLTARVAMRGSSGDTILCCAHAEDSCLSLVSASNHSHQKQTLSPRIPFPVSSLSLNQSGKMLAAVGEFCVSVVLLPPSRKQLPPHAITRNIKILTIGDIYHVKDTSRIVQVAWHPLSHEYCHLLVLTADGWLRMYDVSSDNPSEPEQSCCFSDQSDFGGGSLLSTPFGSAHSTPLKSVYVKKSAKSAKTSKKSVFGLDLDEREAVSFAIGGSLLDDALGLFSGDDSAPIPNSSSAAATWNSLTVYGLMKSGDVYAICPFIPHKSILSASILQNLLRFNRHAWKSNPSGDAYAEKQFYWRNRWLEDALAQHAQQQQQHEGLPSDRVVVQVSRSLNVRLVPERQGPFLVLPERSEAAENGKERVWSDLAVISGAGGASVLIVAVDESGTVDVGIELSSPLPQWEMAEVESAPANLPSSLFPYEQIKLVDIVKPQPSVFTSPPFKFSKDPKYNDVLYVVHAAGVHLLSFRAWFDKLAFAIKAGKAELASLLTGEHVDTEVQSLVETLNAVGNEMASFAVVNDVILGYFFIASTASNDIVGGTLTLRPHTIALLSPALAASKPVAKSTLKIAAYRSSIKTALEIPKAFTEMQPVIAPGDGDTPLDDALMRTLNTKIAGIRTSIGNLKSGSFDIQNRLEDVQTEAISQHEHAQSYLNSLEPLAERSGALAKRMDVLARRQEVLNARADAVLQVLMDRAQPELNAAEKRFFAELKDLGSRLRSILKPRLGQVQKQKEVLLAQVRAVVGPGGTVADLAKSVGTEEKSNFAPGQVSRIKDALAYEYKLLTDTWKKVESVKLALDS